MADKKTGSARRPSRDEDEAPKKKQSGIQKPIKKTTSARKAPPPEEDSEEEEAPRPKKSARAGRGDSARSSGGPPKKGPDNAKIFLYFVPGVILLILAFGVYLAMLPEEKPKGPVTINFDSKIDEAQKKYNVAKAAYQDGAGKEGAAGVPKLSEAYRNLSEGQRMIQDVRNQLAALEKSTDKNTQLKEGQKSGDVKKATSTGYKFDELSTQIGSLKIMCRKALAERDGGMESIRDIVKKEQADEAASGDNDPDGLLK